MSYYVPDVLHRPGALVEGRYRLLALISRGRRSVVYRGRDEVRRREVAVKIVPGVATVVDANRVGRVRHPCIVEVLDVAPVGPEHTAIVMEWVPGTALSVVLQSGPLNEAASRAVMEQLASAVQASHSQRVVHGRICPQNVILSDDEDRGLVAKLGGLDDLIVPFSGGVELPPRPDAPVYDPPEYTDRAAADPSADLYSLGMTVWHAVAGQPRDVVPAPGRASIRVPSIDGMPSRMLAILQTCSAASVENRYKSADELVEDIQRRYSPTPVVVLPRRAIMTAATIAMVLVALVLLGLTVVTFGGMTIASSSLIAQTNAQPALSALRPIQREAPPAAAPSAGTVVPVGEPQGTAAAEAGPETGEQPTSLPDEPLDVRSPTAEPQSIPLGLALGGGGLGTASPGPRAASVGPTAREPVGPADAEPATGMAEVSTPVESDGGVASSQGSATPLPGDGAAEALAETVAAPSQLESGLPMGLAGTTRWTGEIVGRPAEWTLQIAPDGRATASSRTRIGSDWVVRRLAGTASPVDGGVNLELKESDASGTMTMRGTLADGSGEGQVAVRGRDRGRWGMRRLP